MARFTVSPQAHRNLIDIWKFIAKDSIRNADRVYERFYEAFALLGSQPAMGPASDDIEPGTRRFPVGNYIIYYRIAQNGVQILHVFHGKRDQRKAMSKKKGSRGR